MVINLQLPLKDIFVTQPFGVNYVGFYQKLGLKGHNGIDFRARRGCKVYAMHDGFVTQAGNDGVGGIGVTILSSKKGEGFKTNYYHLEDKAVEAGQDVKTGQLIGYSDNTGKYTTADHLHIDLKKTVDGITQNYDNGYKGCIDPAPYFPKNWDKSNAYHRYGREKDWLAEFKMRFKNPWLHRQLKNRGLMSIIYQIEPINALIYGGWAFEDVINPALYEIWGWCKKDEYLRGKINFA
jgi:murein DD-endopeptidase MepM/ murein hydrolase activator NlpD